jgi:flavodoxin
MPICIIYHSETGNTRRVAEEVARATGADLVEVKDLAHYSRIGRYLKGAPRANRGERDAIEPSVIDVTAYDTIAVGSPVWSGHPTPAINAAIDGLKGCEGKAGIAFCTAGGMPGQTLEIMRSALEGRGMAVQGAVALTAKEVKAGDMTKKLAELVSSTSAGSSMRAPPPAPPA